MSTRGRRGQKTKASKEEITKDVVTKPPTKKLKGIDMTHIPESLRKEGYTSDLSDHELPHKTIKLDQKIMETLTCPICKELLVQPQLYGCGHSVCKLCISPVSRICPVCKLPDPRPATHNFTVSALIESLCKEKHDERLKQINELQELKKKVSNYGMSKRFDEISRLFDDFINERKIVKSEDLIQHLMTKKISFTPSVTEQEAKYLISLKVERHTCTTLGTYLIQAMDTLSIMDWIESQEKLATSKQQKQKKKKNNNNSNVEITELKKLAPFVMLSIYRAGGTGVLQRVASLANVDIGKDISLEEWKSQPSYWIKDIDIGDVRVPFLCGCGRNHDEDSFVSDSDEYYSSSDEDDW